MFEYDHIGRYLFDFVAQLAGDQGFVFYDYCLHLVMNDE